MHLWLQLSQFVFQLWLKKNSCKELSRRSFEIGMNIWWALGFVEGVTPLVRFAHPVHNQHHLRINLPSICQTKLCFLRCSFICHKTDIFPVLGKLKTDPYEVWECCYDGDEKCWDWPGVLCKAAQPPSHPQQLNKRLYQTVTLGLYTDGPHFLKVKLWIGPLDNFLWPIDILTQPDCCRP